MSQLALHLLGPPSIERDGVPIQVDTRKAIALLAYVAVTETRHRRASLLNLLWPEYDRTRGGAALRRTLYALNKALAGDWLDVDGQEIGLLPGSDVWVDVHQFRRYLAECESHGHSVAQVCPACAIPLTEAVALYRGDFLTGFGLRDSSNFDDWQLFQAEALRRGLAGALERLVLWHSTQREFDLAVAYGKRWLALDPLDEQAHCQLMRVYAWSGQRSAALCQYEECVRVLKDQLGVPPEEPTTELYTAIREGNAPPVPAPHRGPDHAAYSPYFQRHEPAERPVFVARDRELAQLSRHLDAAVVGRGRVVFVTGDAGCGKTALLQEFARRSQMVHDDLVIAWGHGNAHTGVGDPYLPFRQVLELLTGDIEAWGAARAMTEEQARRLWHLLPLAVQALVKSGPDLVELLVPGGRLLERARAFSLWPARSVWLTQLEKLVARKATVPGGPNLQQGALFEQCTQVLRTLSSQRPLLLALDDLQWADGRSINLLFHLGRHIEGSRILIVGAYRQAEVALGRPVASLNGGMPTDHKRHPLEPVVNELKRYYGDIEIDLEQADGRQFVDAFLDSEPNHLAGAFRKSLHRHTGGYPLFTVELLRGMQERGDLVKDEKGRWIQGPGMDWETLPARVEAVIAERIDRLPPELREALITASVEGESFTAELVAQIRAVGDKEMIRNLSDTLDRRHRLVTAQGVLRLGSQRLSRYRFRHILYQKHLYRSLDPVERVHLHQAVGTALETLYAAGMEQVASAESGAVQLARHFQEAGWAEKAIDYLWQAGERAQRLYANEEAVDHFRQALELLEGLPPDQSRRHGRLGLAARLHEHLGDVLEWTGDHDPARKAYGQALACLPHQDQFGHARLHRKTGNIWRLQGQHERALETYGLAESVLGQGSAESGAEWWAEWVQIQLERMWLHYWLGQWQHISALVAQVRPAVEKHGTPAQCISFFLSIASMNSRRDRYVASDETLTFCQTALAISLESEDLSEIAWARFMLGFNLLWAGDLEGAEKQMETALALAERTGDIVHRSRCLTYLTILHRKRGELDSARHYASRSLELATAAHMVEYIGTAQANLAWVAWRGGDLVQAEVQGRAALASWHQLPAGHSSCAFQWTALWPLIGAALAGDRISEASVYAQTLLDATQQRLPGVLTEVLAKADQACQEGASAAARAWFNQAIALAQELSCF